MNTAAEPANPPKRRRGRPKGSGDKVPRKPKKSASQPKPGRAPMNIFEPPGWNNSRGERASPKKPELRPDPVAKLMAELGVSRTEKSAAAMRRKRRVFFKVLSSGFSITKAARSSGLDPLSIRRWRKRHAIFDAAVIASEAEGSDTLEDGLTEMALGIRSGASFLPTISALKARKPQKFRENVSRRERFEADDFARA